jgi:hypothetical protein
VKRFLKNHVHVEIWDRRVLADTEADGRAEMLVYLFENGLKSLLPDETR